VANFRGSLETARLRTTLRRLKKKLQDNLSLSSKILLRRIFARALRPFRKPEQLPWTAPEVKPWNAVELSLVLDELSGKPSATSSTRPIRTSIVIPVFNKADFTFQCLRSLAKEIDFNTTEVIVVNNASTDETGQLLSKFSKSIRVIDNEENRGFVEACNQGAAAATGDYLVFLNNDTIVLPGWLQNLLDTVDSDALTGAVGSMLLYPNGSIQEAGSVVWKTGEAYHYGWGEPAADRKYNFAREVDYCSAASLLIRNNLFDRLGGFDGRYAPAYYEDVDLCFGVRSLGYKVVFQPLSRVIHYEGVTAGRDTSLGVKPYQLINRQKFFEKWRNVLEREQFEADLSKADEAANRKAGPRIIVFDDRVPMPDRDAGSARMFQILKSLAGLGRTVFVPLKPLPEYEALLWKEGVETANVVDYPKLIKHRQFSVAILSRPEVAAAMMRNIRRMDHRVKLVFDMVDAYFIRLRREHALTNDPTVGKEARHFEKLELELAKRSDQVWNASSLDSREVAKYVGEDRVAVVPTIHPLHSRGKSFEDRAGLLFIGHLAHRPNVDAVLYFLEQIYPLIGAALPSINFYIVGSYPPKEIAAYASDTVHVMGYVPDINPLFQSARVFIAPLRFGAGINGKIGEALSYSLPVVTTSLGASGFALTPGDNALIADEPQEFANHVVKLYRDRDLWQHLAERGYRHIEERFTPEIIGKTIETALRRIGVLDQRT
jgi:GT2 family glycosyltransferase/glycosyltransferase involved in cell wall biosynthesis